MGWLEEHLETFVRPKLGRIPNTSPLSFTPSEMAYIKNAWRSAKRQADGRKIFLPGRDVFIFEILARREGYPTIFRPDCSRLTARHMSLPYDCLLLDTGFAGSIPTALGTQDFLLLSHGNKWESKQVFPRLTNSRELALKMESSPKYWEVARIRDGSIVQSYSKEEEFERAAQLTISVYKDSSPKLTSGFTPNNTGGPQWIL